MVPLLAWDQPVGLVSIGEFFTPNCSKLRDPAIQITSANKLLPILGDTQSREMPVLREEQVEGVLTAVQHLARIIPTNSLSTLCERNNFMDLPERIDHSVYDHRVGKPKSIHPLKHLQPLDTASRPPTCCHIVMRTAAIHQRSRVRMQGKNAERSPSLPLAPACDRRRPSARSQ
jgi:hypothetical protein